MINDDISLIQLESLNNITILGTNQVRVTKGVAVFNDLIFIGPPGSSGHKIKVVSKAIDFAYLSSIIPNFQGVDD